MKRNIDMGWFSIPDIDKNKTDIYYDKTHQIYSFVSKGKKPPKRRKQSLVKI